MSLDESSLRQEIADFISRTLHVAFGPDVTADSDLFASGLLDSYGFVELVVFLERTYGIRLDDDDLQSTDLTTVSGMARLVANRRVSS